MYTKIANQKGRECECGVCTMRMSSRGELPALNLKTAALSTPVFIERESEGGDDDDAMMGGVMSPLLAHNYDLLSSASKAHSNARMQLDLASGTKNWEMAMIPSNGELPFIVNRPTYLKSDTEFLHVKRVSVAHDMAAGEQPAIVRANWKFPSTFGVYIEGTSDYRHTDQFPLTYSGFFEAPTSALRSGAVNQESVKRRITSGEFHVVSPTELIIDYHIRPLRYVWSATYLLQQGARQVAVPRKDLSVVQANQIFGPVPDDTRGPEEWSVNEYDVPYLMVVGITAVKERIRLCGSMIYYDDVDEPSNESEAMEKIMQSCPYLRIGDEFKGPEMTQVVGKLVAG